MLEPAKSAAVEQHGHIQRPATLSALKRDTVAFAARVLLTIALAATGILYAARTIAIFPLEHDVTEANSFGDDWLKYHEYAVNVLDGGLTIPMIPGVYMRPAGFGYVYFVASIYAVAGVRSEVVYLVQGLLLIGASVGMYFVFRSRLSALTALALLLALAVFMYIDVYRATTFRLLSENLLYPLFPLLLFFLLKGEATGKHRYFILGGVVCGLCFLVRPNLIAVGPTAAAVVLFFKSQRSFSWRAQAAVALVAACAAVGSLLPLRNYAVTQQLSLASATSQADWTGQRIAREPGLSTSERARQQLRRVVRRTAFLAGIPQLLRPNFRFRAHWVAMWATFIWYLWTLPRRGVQFWEVLVLSLVVAYLAPIMAFASISSYGGRMLVPAFPLVLVLAAKGLDGTIALKGAR